MCSNAVSFGFVSVLQWLNLTGEKMNNENELTAALATIEKLRAERDQLTAENVGLKAAINAVNRTAEECEVNGDELKYVVEPSEFEALIDFMDETPATDRIYAAQRSAFVDEAVAKITDSGALTFGDCIVALCQLREGAK